MFKMMVSLAIAAQLAGCANQPVAQTAASDSASSALVTGTAGAPAEATMAATAAATAAAATTPSATAAAATTAPAKATPPPGYKKRIRKDGATVYCTKLQPTGSMFPQDVCYTPEQLETLRAQQKKSADRLLNKPVGCRVEGCVTGQ
jgi:hypothetical protein